MHEEEARGQEVLSFEDEERERKIAARKARDEAHPLESVSWLTKETKREFRATMEAHGIAEGSDEWKKQARELIDRLWAEADEPDGSSGPSNMPTESATPSVEPGVRPAVGQVESDVEGRPIRVPGKVYSPTDQERREHDVTHYPYRSWCSCCVEARAAAEGHFRSDPDEIQDSSVGEFHFD